MLIPAIAYKKEIEEYSDKMRYSDEMMFYNGCREHGRIYIKDDYDDGTYQWAIVDKGELVGYIAYQIDHYSSSAYSFGLISFVPGHGVAVGAAIISVIQQLEKMKINRVEWRGISGNPATAHYLNIIKFLARKNNYIISIYELHEVFKDRYDKYRNAFIFEVRRKKI